VGSVAQRLGVDGLEWQGAFMRVQTALHSHRAGSILLLQLLTPISAC